MAHAAVTEVRITLRLPSDTHAALIDAAARNSRSMNGEILARLEKSFDPDYSSVETEGFKKSLKECEIVRAIQTDLIASQEEHLRALRKGVSSAEEMALMLAETVSAAADGDGKVGADAAKRAKKIIALMNMGK